MHTISTHVLQYFGVALATLGIVLVFLVGSAHAQVLGAGGSTGIEWYTLGSPYMYTTPNNDLARLNGGDWLPGGYYPNWATWMQMFSQVSL